MLVLTADSKCSNSDWFSYNEFFFNVVGNNSTVGKQPLSVRSVCFLNDDAANDELVVSAATNASLVFATGGDQSRYYHYWRGSKMASVISKRVASNQLVFAGSSAGLAIQSQFIFSALNGGISSQTALDHPLRPDIARSPFQFPCLNNNLIVDTHFYQVSYERE